MTKKERIGIVVSTKNNKTLTIIVQTRSSHPKYDKTVVQTKRYMVHDENNSCKTGDLVLIEESAPISRCKKWKLKQILKTN
jgi:small subunit ribosomal protein S17